MILDKKFYEAHGVFKSSALWLQGLAVSFFRNTIGPQRYLDKALGPAVSWPKFIEAGAVKCHSCDLCVKICPTQALSLENKGNTNNPSKLWLTLSRCTQCTLCVEACPEKVLTMGHDRHLAFHGEQNLKFEITDKAI